MVCSTPETVGVPGNCHFLPQHVQVFVQPWLVTLTHHQPRHGHQGGCREKWRSCRNVLGGAVRCRNLNNDNNPSHCMLLYPLEDAFTPFTLRAPPGEDGKATLPCTGPPFTAKEVKCRELCEMSLENPILRATPLLLQARASGQHSSVTGSLGQV